MLRGGVVIIIVFLGDYHSLTEMNIGDLCPIMLVSLCLTLSYYVASYFILKDGQVLNAHRLCCGKSCCVTF
jgi:hypothetical protein